MSKAVPSSPPANLVVPKRLAAEIDQMVAQMNTPEHRAACNALFSASSVDLGRAAMKAHQLDPKLKTVCPIPPKN